MAYERNRPTTTNGCVFDVVVVETPVLGYEAALIRTAKTAVILEIRLDVIYVAGVVKTGIPREALIQDRERPACAIGTSLCRMAVAVAFIVARERPPPLSAPLLICQVVGLSKPIDKPVRAHKDGKVILELLVIASIDKVRMGILAVHGLGMAVRPQEAVPSLMAVVVVTAGLMA